MDSATIKALAQRWTRPSAAAARCQLSLDHPDITIADAYAIQREWVASKIAAGRRLVGHKIGLTSRAMQLSSQIDEPDYGALLDDMLYGDGAEIPRDRYIVPRVEVELAFILERLQGPDVTLFDVLDAALRDSRAGNHRRALAPDRSRHQAPAQGLRHHRRQRGQRRRGHGRPPCAGRRHRPALGRRHDVAQRRDRGDRPGGRRAESSGQRRVWLANKLAEHDVALEAGQIILSGSFTRPVTPSAATPSTSTTARWAPSAAVSSEESRIQEYPQQPARHISTTQGARYH